MDLEDVAATEAVRFVTREVARSLLDYFSDLGKESRVAESASKSLNRHIEDALRWSETIQFYGMSQAEDVESLTIELQLDTVPRKFRGINTKTSKITELSLLTDDNNYLLLGDPGSGKTTTIKRLVRFILLEEPVSPSDLWQYPIVIRLREIEEVEPLEAILAGIFGLSFELVHYEKKVQEPDAFGKYRWVVKEFTRYEHQGLILGDIVAEILNRTRALVLLDGLDEISHEKRSLLDGSISDLARKLTASKLIVSCRSGDYTQQLEEFNTVELCPLELDQVDAITSKWLPGQEDFLGRLRSLPFHDLATRPLFLCQLIVFYRNTGYLPDKPSVVYRTIIRLSLEHWDEQRRVKRKSRYASFDPEQKIDFLSALSYHLTYKVKVKRFSEELLVEAYIKICQPFSLPKAEARLVAREIESHTGIILESGGDHYEFSHLSLQEYLCAYYLIREPFARKIGAYLSEYPAPIAVAASLSANPSKWLAALILNRSETFNLSAVTVSSLLSRLVQERPQFQHSLYLGFALIKLAVLFQDTVLKYILELLQNSEVRASLSNALKKCIVDPGRDVQVRGRASGEAFGLDESMHMIQPHVRLKKRGERMAFGEEDGDFNLAIGGRISKVLLATLVKHCGLSLKRVKTRSVERLVIV